MLSYKKAVLKETDEHSQGRVFIKKYGKGKVIYCALPVEGGSEIRPIEELYRFALKIADIPLNIQIEVEPSILIRPITFDRAILYCIVNESSVTKEVKINSIGGNLKVHLEGQRAALVMVSSEGKIIDSYPPKNAALEERI